MPTKHFILPNFKDGRRPQRMSAHKTESQSGSCPRPSKRPASRAHYIASHSDTRFETRLWTKRHKLIYKGVSLNSKNISLCGFVELVLRMLYSILKFNFIINCFERKRTITFFLFDLGIISTISVSWWTSRYYSVPVVTFGQYFIGIN